MSLEIIHLTATFPRDLWVNSGVLALQLRQKIYVFKKILKHYDHGTIFTIFLFKIIYPDFKIFYALENLEKSYAWIQPEK